MQLFETCQNLVDAFDGSQSMAALPVELQLECPDALFPLDEFFEKRFAFATQSYVFFDEEFNGPLEPIEIVSIPPHTFLHARLHTILCQRLCPVLAVPIRSADRSRLHDPGEMGERIWDGAQRGTRGRGQSRVAHRGSGEDKGEKKGAPSSDRDCGKTLGVQP